MPIIVEKMLSAKDLSDIDRSYLLKVVQNEAVDLWQTIQPSAATAEDFLDNTLDNPQQILYAARFNNNYIALAVVNHEQSENQPKLHVICVRDLTRRRGVGKQLLIEIAQQEQSPIRCTAPSANGALINTLQAAGFVKDESSEDKNSDGPNTDFISKR